MAQSWRSALSGRISIPRTALQPTSSCTTRMSLVCARPLNLGNKPFLYHPHISSGRMAFAALQQGSAVLSAWHGVAACTPWQLEMCLPVPPPTNLHACMSGRYSVVSAKPWCSKLHQQGGAKSMLTGHVLHECRHRVSGAPHGAGAQSGC